MTEEFDALEDQYEGPSKTQIKREMHALRDLGERITELPKGQRDALPLSEAMRRALVEFTRIRSREARRRHLSFIGKIMRSENLDAIHDMLERSDTASAVHTRELHAVEAWRTALLADDSALSAFIDAYPGTDRPRLRAHIRSARQEAERGQDRRHYRVLFQTLRDEAARTGRVLAPGEGPGDG